jgi:hypothetical protein
MPGCGNGTAVGRTAVPWVYPEGERQEITAPGMLSVEGSSGQKELAPSVPDSGGVASETGHEICR